MGITEDLLNKKREETQRQKEMAFYGEMGITKQLLARRKAGLSAIPSPAESVGASLSEGILGQNNAKRMANTIYQREMENRRENAVSPTQALEQMRGYTFSHAPSITLPTAQEMDAYDLQQTLKIADQKKAELDRQIAAQKAVQQKNNAGAAPAYAAISGTQLLRPAQISAPSSAAAGQNVKPAEQTEQEQAFAQASQRIWGLQREKDALSYIQDNAGKTYDDNFIGQFGASYTLGRLTQDESLAWNKYLDNPTEENRAYAEAIGQVISAFQLENQEVLADDARLPWVSQSLANYLPQFVDQVKYGAVGAVSGGTVGSVIPVLGTAAGIKAGITAASGVYSYQTMRGAAFKTLLDLGVPENVAREAANDEAVVSSAIEMADTGIDILTMGGKEVIAALTGGAAKTAAKKGAESAVKKFLKAMGKYGFNVAREWAEEATQQAVSIANAKRVETGEMNGIFDLAGDAAKVFGKALWDKEDKNRAEILEAGEQGAIVAGLMGPLEAGFNQLAYTGVTALDSKASADYGQQLRSKDLESVTIEAGLKFDEGSRIRQMAEALQQKQQNGQEVTDVELGDLYRQIKIGARQEYQNAVQQAQNETAVQQQKESGIMLPTADEMDAMLGVGSAESSLRQSGMEAGATEQAIESAERISTALGRDIQFFRQEAGERGTVNGFFDPNNGTIYVNSQSQNPVAQIIAHEMTHSVELADSYQELRGVVMDQLQKDGIDIDRRRQEIQALYERNGKPLKTPAEIDQEIVAQFVETRLLTDEQTILDLTRTNRSLMERVLDWINRTLQKLGVRKTTERDTLEKARDLYARALQESREQEQNAAAAQQQKEVQDAVEYLRNALASGEITESEYDEAMESVMEQASLAGVNLLDQQMSVSELEYKAGDTNSRMKAVNSVEGAKFSISETYERDIDTWDAAGRPDGEVFILGETGDVLQGLGAMEQDIYLRSEKVNKILQEHQEMTLEEIKRIPEVLDDPVLVLKSQGAGARTENTRLVLFGTLRAKNGQPVLAVLDLRPIENMLAIDDMQKVNSAYTKDRGAANFVQRSEVLYADEKRTTPLLRLIGLTIASRRLLRSGSVGSIAYSNGTVNLHGIPLADVVQLENSSKDGGQLRYSIADDQEPIETGITLPTADKVFAQDEETAQNTGSEGKQNEDLDAGEAVRELDDGYWEGLFEEAEQSLQDEEWVENSTPDAEEVLRTLANENPDSHAEVYAETGGKSADVGFLEMVEQTSEYRRLAMDQYPKEEIGEGKVQTDAEKKQISLAKRVRDGYRAFLRAMVDSGEAVSRAAKAFQDESLYAYYNAVRAASSAAENMIRNESTNTLGERTGDSLVEVLKNVRSKGKEYYRKFQLYMYHMHNVDRMRLENMAEVEQARAEFENIRDNAPELKKFAEYQIERMAKDPNSEFHEEAREYIRARDNMRRAEGHRNKPVFGEEVTAQKSQEVTARLLQQYPEFEQEAKKVYGYLDNLMQYRIDSGLVTEEDAKALKRIYPHYVPVYRDIERNSTDTREMRRVQIGKTIKRATGGNQIIVPLHKAIALQTRSVVREGTKNRFGRRLMWGSDSAIKEKNEIQRLGMEQDLEKQMELLEKRIRESKGFIRNVDVAKSDFHQDTFDQLEDVEPKRKNIFTIREGGRRYDLEVDPSIFAAVEAVGGDQETGNNILTATVRKFNNLFKAMVTGYNPVFLARNFLRDIQDAALYSQSSASWAKNYPQALQEIAKNGKYWRQYQALGGVFSSVFDYETGNTREQSKNPVAILVRKIEALNMAIEQAPRLAEFMATVKEAEKSDIGVTMNTLMDALHNANEITTNFGRSGTVGKWLNANLVPFLNPSIQGFDKMIRELGKARSFQGAVKLVAKAALLGIAPAALNQLLCGDEDDWDKIKQRDKDIYYLIPLGGGKWIKIPKGRALSLAGLSANRIAAAARGEKIDFIDTLSTAWSQTAPSNPLENNILQAWMDADLLDPDSPGKTWYGSDIESQRLQSYAPGERYDENTDKLSKWIGENTGLSPAKINYLLDQYTGVIGDVVLPLITPSDTSIPFLAPAISAFTMDTAYSNRISGDFYNTLDELIYAKNEDGASGVQDVIYKFFNKQADAVGEINNAIRETEADPNLSDAEKRELNRVQYQMRNAIEEQALERVEAYRAAAEKYFEVSDEEEEADRIEEAYREANREVMGAEYALKTYNKGVYERAQALQKDCVSYDTFYELYFENQDTDLTGYEKTNRTRELIRDLDVDDGQKKALYMDFISDSDTNQERIEALEKAGATFDDFLNIQNQYNVINETFDKAKRKSIEFAYWLDTEGFTSEQIKAAQEGFLYYSQIPGDGTSYLELRETGMSQEEAHRLAVGIDELTPAEGKKTVSDPQKWGEIAGSDIPEDQKLEALKRNSNESQAKKFQIAWDYGVDLGQYVEVMERLPEFDADGNGNYNQEEVTAALNGMSGETNNRLVLPDLSGGLVLPTAGEYGNRDKAVLWQLITNAKSAKNNPFDTEIGEEVLSAMEKYKEEGLILPDLNGSDGGLVLPKLESGLVLPPLG